MKKKVDHQEMAGRAVSQGFPPMTYRRFLQLIDIAVSKSLFMQRKISN